MSTITLTCERMAYGPFAIAHMPDGKTVFVEGGAPGSSFEVELYKEKKSLAYARARALVDAGPHYRDAESWMLDGIREFRDATLFERGLDLWPWAHLSYEQQISEKRANIVWQLSRALKLNRTEVEALVEPVATTDKIWHYRNKCELVAQGSGKDFTLGVFSNQAQKVVPMDAYPLMNLPNPKLIKQLQGALKYISGSHTLGISRVGIRYSERTKDLEIALWTEPSAFPRAMVAKVLQEATGATSIVRVMQKGPKAARKISGVERLNGAGFWRETIAGNEMRLSAPSFFQVNTQAAELLIYTALSAVEKNDELEAMDLYCGAGTFTIPLVQKVGFVSAVESYGPSVRDLRRNLETLKLSNNCDVIGGDVAYEFPEDTDPTFIIVDPPAAGLDARVVAQLCKLQSLETLVYVSCDPATLARDLARFHESGQFNIKKVQPVDLFPQTYHCETVCVMSRVEGKYTRKPSNTAVFGQSGKFGIGQDERFSVTY